MEQEKILAYGLKSLSTQTWLLTEQTVSTWKVFVRVKKHMNIKQSVTFSKGCHGILFRVMWKTSLSKC